MESSFISEHTLEYIIVPRILELLSQRFDSIVPIYFWTAREGNSLSRKIHQGESLKIMAVFPRRPKFIKDDLNIVYGKINETIIKYSLEAKSRGLPVIFSFPVISSLKDIAKNVTIKSFEVVAFVHQDIHFIVNKETKKIKVLNSHENFINLLNDTDLLTLVTNARVFSWEEAILNIKELRRVNLLDEYSPFFSWNNPYKPIYFLIFE